MTRPKVVLDSHVLITVTNSNDDNFNRCSQLIERLSNESYTIIAPATALWDMYAYLMHPEKRKQHNMSTGSLMFEPEDVTKELFLSTHSASISSAIKGPDRVFISLAKRHNAPLITNDKQILRYASKFGVTAISVDQFLDMSYANDIS